MLRTLKSQNLIPFFHFICYNRENNTPRNTIHLTSSSLLVYTYSGISRPSFWHLHRRPKSYAPLIYGEKLGCKESHFYSLPFGQAEANIY